MPARHHSRATRLAATFLARLASPEVAAATFRVDVRTVRGWQAGGDVPEDTWTAVRDVLLTRGAEMAAKGDTRGLVQTLTAAGISERNVRYGELLRQREHRRAAEQDPEQPTRSAVRLAFDGLPDERKRWAYEALVLSINEELADRGDGKRRPAEQAMESAEETTTDIIEWVNGIAAWTAEEFAEHRAELDATIAEQRVELGADPRAELAKAIDSLDDPASVRDAPPAPAEQPQEPPEPIRLDKRRPPSEPPVVALDFGQHLEDDPSWTPRWRSDL